MARKNSSFDYEILVRYMLPDGILDYFEITKIDEEVTNEKDETGTATRPVHLPLQQGRPRQEGHAGSRCQRDDRC